MSKPNMSRLHHAIDLLGKLVAFDTTSKNSNLELIHFVRDYLAEYGIESTLFHDETGQKANLLATIGPKGVPVSRFRAIPMWYRPLKTAGSARRLS